jgi:archaellum biogenesis ATPase FlaH
VADALKYVLPSEQLLNRYEHLIGDRRDHLWGEHIRVGAVTTIVGETSAGKTTLLHNLAYHLSQGQSFLDRGPPKPLRVLYIDYESYNSILAEHLVEIGVTENWHFFNLETSDIAPRGTHLIGLLTDILRATPYDLLIVDPLLEADPVKDENDPMEATMQMLRWRDLARKHRLGALLVHNTGKGGDFLTAKEKAETAMFRASRKYAGRGASARVDRADIGMNYVVADDTTRILKVAKTRGGNMGHSWTLQFANSQLGYIIKDSHFSVSQPLEDEKCEKLAQVLAEHPGESKLQVYEKYVKPHHPGVSRASFYRMTARSRQAAPAIAPQSLGDGSAPSSHQPPADVQSRGSRTEPHLPHSPSACVSESAADSVGAVVKWRSPHHIGESYGRFLVTPATEPGP